MRTYVLVIPAGGDITIDLAGEFFKLVSYTGTAGTLTVRADSQKYDTVDGAFLTVLVGDKPRFRGVYDKLTFRNTDAVQVTATIIAGMGDHDQDSLVGNVTVAGTVAVSNLAGTSCESPASLVIGAGASSDLALDTTIRERIFTADAANTAEVWLRDQTGVTSVGLPIGGAYARSVVFENDGACRLRNNSGAAQTIHVLNNKG